MVTHCFLSPEPIIGRHTATPPHGLPALARAQPRAVVPMATLLIEHPYPPQAAIDERRAKAAEEDRKWWAATNTKLAALQVRALPENTSHSNRQSSWFEAEL